MTGIWQTLAETCQMVYRVLAGDAEQLVKKALSYLFFLC